MDTLEQSLTTIILLVILLVGGFVYKAGIIQRVFNLVKNAFVANSKENENKYATTDKAQQLQEKIKELSEQIESIQKAEAEKSEKTSYLEAQLVKVNDWIEKQKAPSTPSEVFPRDVENGNIEKLTLNSNVLKEVSMRLFPSGRYFILNLVFILITLLVTYSMSLKISLALGSVSFIVTAMAFFASVLLIFVIPMENRFAKSAAVIAMLNAIFLLVLKFGGVNALIAFIPIIIFYWFLLALVNDEKITS